MTFRIHKTTSQGLSIVEAEGMSISQAMTHLEETRLSHDLADDGIECNYSADGNTLICTNPESFGFKVTYRIRGPGLPSYALHPGVAAFFGAVSICLFAALFAFD